MEKLQERKIKSFRFYEVKPAQTRIELESEFLETYLELSEEKRVEFLTCIIASIPTELLRIMRNSDKAVVS